MFDDVLLQVSLAAAESRDPATVLRAVVDGLAESAGLALARIWLLGPADQCERCPMQTECRDQTNCLHLEASAGNPRRVPRELWSRTNGDFRRLPLGVRKVGHIAATGNSLLVEDVDRDSSWIARPQWAREEGIRSVAGHPLVFRGEILGVLGVFCRNGIGTARFEALRGFAAQAAVSIAHARAFKELTELREQLELERDYLREEVRAAHAPGTIVGSSPALRTVLEQIELVAPTDASVLVLGESGTGKELVAQTVHEGSRRRAAPLVRVNCAAVPRELFESEFFGHVRGAFTGALRDRIGRFELANGGTLFLDEVGEIPIELQGKLLRVLQEGTFERVGEDRTRTVDVRVVAATNRDLRGAIGAGRFREDLYYRLAVFPIDLPPLRERREDILPLAAHFVAQAERRLGKSGLRLTRRDVQALERWSWPGNVRELASVIERASILARNGALSIDALLARATTEWPKSAAVAAPTPLGSSPALEKEGDRKRRERENLEAALTASGGRIYGPGGAAELLGIRPTTLSSRIRALGIRRR